jgi:hypothetical protein
MHSFAMVKAPLRLGFRLVAEGLFRVRLGKFNIHEWRQ